MSEPYNEMIYSNKIGEQAVHRYTTVEELMACSKVLTLTALDILTKTKDEALRSERGT